MFRFGGAGGHYWKLFLWLREKLKQKMERTPKGNRHCKNECVLLEECPSVKLKLQKASCKRKPKRSKIFREFQQLVNYISLNSHNPIFRSATLRVKRSVARKRPERAPPPAQNQILDFTLALYSNV